MHACRWGGTLVVLTAANAMVICDVRGKEDTFLCKVRTFRQVLCNKINICILFDGILMPWEKSEVKGIQQTNYKPHN